MISGTVYAKTKGVVIRRESFKTKIVCKRLIKQYLKRYPNFEVIVTIDDKL